MVEPGPGLNWSVEVGEADWIVQRLHPFGGDIGSVVPDGFEAYVRIFHPARRGTEAVRWSEIAAWSGRAVHSRMQFAELSTREAQPGGTSGWTGQPPLEGSLTPTDLAALMGVLAKHSATPDDCWFGMWNGWGMLNGSAARLEASGAVVPLESPVPLSVREGPVVQIPHREFLLYRGVIADAAAFCHGSFVFWQSPSLWWPSDHSWCVASEIDFAWTYVGGSREAIDAVLECPDLEALEVQLGYPASERDPLNRT